MRNAYERHRLIYIYSSTTENRSHITKLMHGSLHLILDMGNAGVIRKYMLEPVATRASNLDVNRQEGEAKNGCDVKKLMLNYFQILCVIFLFLQPKAHS